MANPQTEDGYTSIANEILNELPKFRLNGTQYRIIMTIWRYTYGFHRKSHYFSLTFLNKSTGLSRDSIKKEVRRLIENKVLVVLKDATFNQARELGFNKYYDQWLVPKDEPVTQDEINNTGGDLSPSPTGGKKSPSQGDNYTPPQGDNYPPKKESIKEIDIYIYSIFNHWKSKRIVNHRELNQRRKSAINARLKSYSVDEIKKAIDNYANVLQSDRHFFTYKFNLEDFMNPKNLDKFIDENDPFNSLLKNEFKVAQFPARASPESMPYHQDFDPEHWRNNG